MRPASLTAFSCLLIVWGPVTGLCPLGRAAEHSTPDSCLGSPCRLVTSATKENTHNKLIPDEPEEYDPREVKAFYDWRNDLFFRHFDMEGMGRTDFMTARRTYRVWLSEFGDPIVLTMANPLFYWVDLNRNGKFEPNEGEMWSDPEEDGVNGNEQHYDVSELQSAGPSVYAP